MFGTEQFVLCFDVATSSFDGELGVVEFTKETSTTSPRRYTTQPNLTTARPSKRPGAAAGMTAASAAAAN